MKPPQKPPKSPEVFCSMKIDLQKSPLRISSPVFFQYRPLTYFFYFKQKKSFSQSQVQAIKEFTEFGLLNGPSSTSPRSQIEKKLHVLSLNPALMGRGVFEIVKSQKAKEGSASAELRRTKTEG
jgi:hypothetical protein